VALFPLSLPCSQEATVTVCRRQEFAKSTACLSVFLLFDGRVGLNFLVNWVFKQSSLHHRILGSPLCVKTCAEFGPFTSQRDELGDGNGQTLSLAPSRNANRQTELQRLEMVALRRPTGANCCMDSKMDLPRISWSPEGKFRDPTRHVAGMMDKWDVSTLAQIRERRIRTETNRSQRFLRWKVSL